MESFGQRAPAAVIAAELRVSERSVRRWRRAWEAGGVAGLASRGQAARWPMDFAPIVAPRDRIIRIWPRCPSCRLMQKSARDLRITALPGSVRLGSHCPRHRPYIELVHMDGRGWYDANTPVRSIQKGCLLSAERDCARRAD